MYCIVGSACNFILFLSLLLQKATGSKMKSSEKLFSKIDLEHYVEDLNSRISPEQELKHEMTILQNALEFNHVKARDCMIPRTEIIAVEVSEPMESTLALFQQKGLFKFLGTKKKEFYTIVPNSFMASEANLDL